MRNYINGAAALLTLCLTTSAVAQVVTVAPSGANFTTVKAAVDSFAPGGPNNGNAADNVITIVQGGVYVEDIAGDPYTTGVLNLSENENYTIRCTDTNLSATIVGSGGATAGGTALIGFPQTSVGKTLTLENLILLPAFKPDEGTSPNTQSGEAVRVDHRAGHDGGLIAKDILISANNGSNAPASNGTAAATGHYTRFGGSGIRMLGGANRLNLENVTATHCTTGVWDNGDVEIPGTHTRVIGPGCRFSFNTSVGYNQGAAGLTGVNGTADRPVVVANNGGQGFWINASPNFLYGDMNYMHIINNKDQTGDTASVSGLHFVATQMPNNSRFYKCIIAGNGSGTTAWGNVSANNSQDTTIRFNDCTIFDAAYDQPAITISNNTGASAHTNFVFTDCIIAGAGDYILFNEVSSGLTITNSATVTAGPHAMDTAHVGLTDTANAIQGPASGPGVTVTNTIHDDPQFVSTTYGDANYLAVTNSAYSAASSTGGPLSGGSTYQGQVSSAVADWSLFM